MVLGNEIETRGHIKGFKEEISKAKEDSPDAFFTWFDNVKDKETAFVRGCWDFSVHFAGPMARYINSPEEKTALEIGHGGGRILASAARHFNHVIGVDIHDHNDVVGYELNTRGISNYKLHATEGINLPIEDGKIDVAYSFIVFQHIEKILIFQNYFQEIYRVLKKGGIAVLYFGRFSLFSINRSSSILYVIDRVFESAFLPKGYKEIRARVNQTNLKVTLRHAKKIARQAGFSICDVVVSKKKVPDGVDLYGGQHGLILQKI